MIIRYEAAEAAALGDPLAAIYLECLRVAEATRGSVVYLAPGEVARAAGMRAAQAARARDLLAERGFVELRGTDGLRTGHLVRHDVVKRTVQAHELQQDAREKSRRKPAPKSKPVQLEAPATAIPIEDVLAGRYDHLEGPALVACEPLLEALFALWVRTYGHDPARTVLTKDRRKAFAKCFVDDRRTPATAARAILGMVEDDWPERPLYSDLEHALGKRCAKFAALYEGVQSGKAQSRRVPTGMKCTTIKGQTVPLGYRWSSADDHAVAEGMTFDLHTQQWMRSRP